MVGFNEIQFVVGGQQAIPVSVFGAPTKEQPYSNAGQYHISHCVIAMHAATVFDGLPTRKQLDKFLCAEQLLFKQVFGLGHLDHAQVIATGVSGFDELHNIGACKPTVRQQIIKTYALTNGVLDHFNGFLNLALGVFTNAIVNGIGLLANLRVLLVTLFPGHAVGLIRTTSLLSVKRKIQNRLRLAIGTAKKKGLESKQRGMGDMRKDATKLFDLRTSLWKIGVVDNQAHRIIALDRFIPQSNLAKQLPVNAVKHHAPIEGSIFHESIKNILFAGNNLGKGGVSVMKSVFDHE